MPFEFLSTTSDRVIAHQLASDGQSGTLVIELEMLEHSEIGSDVARLNDALAATGKHLVQRASDLSASGRYKEAQGMVDRTVRPAFRLAIEAQRRAVAKVESEREALFAPRFSKDSTVAVRAEQRTWARGLSLAKGIETASADTSLAAAIVEGGQAMSGLPEDIFDRLHITMATNQLAERIMQDTSMQTAPSADDPVGGKPDHETARKAAEARLERIHAEREMLERVPTTLAHVVAAVALMTGEAREAAFQRLSA